MPTYLLDTNVLLRFSDGQSPEHALATAAVHQVRSSGSTQVIAAQNLVEFWAVATRPVEVNGLGWTPAQARAEVDRLRAFFPVLKEEERVLEVWLDLVTPHQIKGKKVHDARLAAVMLTHGLTHLLTFNPSDFDSIPGLTLVHPSAVPAPPPLTTP